MKPTMGRPTSVVVKPTEVLAALTPFLDKRQPGFKWDGSDYQRPSRNQSADKDGLDLYSEPLRSILTLAPSGFPTHASLREAFELCDEKFKIFDDEKGHGRHTTAARAADVWRKMCGDVYQMAKTGIYEAKIQPLIDCIVLARGHTSYTHTCTHARIHAHIHAHMRTYIHNMHTLMHTYVLTYIHTGRDRAHVVHVC
jgi:hypothetical protein